MTRSYFFNRPKQPPITDQAELLRQIERKDAWFRVVNSIFFALIFVALVILLSLNYKLQASNNDLIKSQGQALKAIQASTNQLKENDKNTAASFADLQQHIDCIVNLFTQPNRANLSITNIQTCQLSTSALGGSTGSTKSGSVSGTPTKSTSSNSSNNAGTVPATTPPNQPTPQPKPKPTPVKTLVCTITLKVLCLK